VQQNYCNYALSSLLESGKNLPRPAWILMVPEPESNRYGLRRGILSRANEESHHNAEQDKAI
jgi:hypothetical protein